MQGLLLMLLTIVLSHKVIVDYGTTVEGLTTLTIITLNSNGYFYPFNNVAFRTFHDGECTFLSSSIVELTVLGKAYFELLCVCPNFEMCKVSFTAKDFSVGSIYINTYLGEDFKIKRQIDKYWVTVGHSFNLNVQYVDEDDYSLDSPILIDDYKGEAIVSTKIADQKNGLAEFNLTYSTTGLKTFRIITNYLIYSDKTNFLTMHQIAINQVNIIKNIRTISLILNNNDSTKQTILTNEPFSITLQAFEPETTKVDIKEQSKVQITISSTESENVTISGTFVNGVVIFNNLAVLYYGSYNIVTTPDGFNTAMISRNVTGYLSINFVDGIKVRFI